jgi:predicted nucleotidyltransferase
MDGDAPDLLSDAERTFLSALNELGVRYLIVGMSAALLQGARGATEDIDLWFENLGDPRIGEAARRAGGFWITRSQPPLLGGPIGDRFDVVTSLSGIPAFAAEFVEALEEDLGGVQVRVLPLERILHSKRVAGRPKDEPGIRQIELALEIIRKLSK